MASRAPSQGPSRAPSRPLPSVLEPKTSIPPVPLDAAISYLTSQLNLHSNLPSLPRTVTTVQYDVRGAAICHPPSQSPQKSTPSSLDDFILDSSYTLQKLILHIQSIIDAKTVQKGEESLLVKSVEVRMGSSNYVFLKEFPSIAGVLAGGGILVGNAEKEAEYVVWGDEKGMVVAYWEAFRETLMKGFLFKSDKPILKVRTVKRVGRFRNVHVFRERVLVIKNDEESSEGEGENLAESVDGQDLIARAIERFRQRLVDLPSLDAPEFQVAGLYQEALKNDPNTSMQEIYEGYLKSGGRRMKELVFKAKVSGGYDQKLIPKDPTKNWGIYQRIGGEKRWHKLFPLDHVPFPPQGVEVMWIGPDEYEEAALDNSMTVSEIHLARANSPYTSVAMPPQLLDLLSEDNQAAVSFDSKDDEAFLPQKRTEPLKEDGNPRRIAKHRNPSTGLRNFVLDQTVGGPVSNNAFGQLHKSSEGLAQQSPGFSFPSQGSSPNTSASNTPSSTPKLSLTFSNTPNLQANVRTRHRNRSPLKHSSTASSQLRPDSPAFSLPLTRQTTSTHQANLLRMLDRDTSTGTGSELPSSASFQTPALGQTMMDVSGSNMGAGLNTTFQGYQHSQGTGAATISSYLQGFYPGRSTGFGSRTTPGVQPYRSLGTSSSMMGNSAMATNTGTGGEFTFNFTSSSGTEFNFGFNPSGANSFGGHM
ncbi:hypothetical protein G7Y89_g4171 [Cudoniella acicularis]|uniref:Uncharacterized protein n=1 Tax=Cudoniella acicularis TaxID=354080 RepID=A0A8H4RRE2_9HELO|nr:hypothetical protein G7Y89_g4171 [Cudoniella acicularis]